MDKVAIQQIETFTKTAMERVSELEALVQEKTAALQQKEAAETKQRSVFTKAVEKAARSLYEADYITDDRGETFIKKAMENPAHLARIIERLCEASSEMGMGKVSNVKAMGETEDPIIRIMNGGTGSSTYSIVDED